VRDNRIAGLLMGRVLCAILPMRGITCLHAGAVAFDGRAIAFVGRSGAGKSTIVAALRCRGGFPLTDDLVALTEDEGAPVGQTFLVHPSRRGLRLRPDAAAVFCGVGAALRRSRGRADSTTDKSYLELESQCEGLVRRPVPLACIYLLDMHGPVSTTPAILSVAGVDRLISLAPHARARVLLEKDDRVKDFTTLGRLAATVPIGRIRRPNGLDSLPAVCDAILKDVASLPVPGLDAVLLNHG
jgi:hypothetical protein